MLVRQFNFLSLLLSISCRDCKQYTVTFITIPPDKRRKTSISFSFLNKNIWCGCSFEASRRDASNDPHNKCFGWKIKKIWQFLVEQGETIAVPLYNSLYLSRESWIFEPSRHCKDSIFCKICFCRIKSFSLTMFVFIFCDHQTLTIS